MLDIKKNKNKLLVISIVIILFVITHYPDSIIPTIILIVFVFPLINIFMPDDIGDKNV